MYGKLSITQLFWHLTFFKMTDEYLPQTVLNCKLIDPKATTLSYVFQQQQQNILSTFSIRLNEKKMGIETKIFM